MHYFKANKIILITLAALSFQSCDLFKQPVVSLEGISITEERYNLKLFDSDVTYTGDSFAQLEIVFTPLNATDKSIIYESLDDSIVTVSGSGKLQARGPGSTIITAKSNDGNKIDSCIVTVTQWNKKVIDSSTTGIEQLDSNCASKDENIVYTAGYLHIYKSIDGGSSWTTIMSSTESNPIAISGISCSDDGQYVTAVTRYDNIFRTSDGGSTWETKSVNLNGDGDESFTDISMTNNGMTQVATVSNSNYLYMSTDYGVSWFYNSANLNEEAWSTVTISKDGKYVALGGAKTGTGIGIWYSSDSGNTFNKSNAPNTMWHQIRSSENGQILIAGEGVVGGGLLPSNIYISKNYGESWTPLLLGKNYIGPYGFQFVDISRDGTIISGAFSLSSNLLSIDTGINFSETDSVGLLPKSYSTGSGIRSTLILQNKKKILQFTNGGNVAIGSF